MGYAGGSSSSFLHAVKSESTTAEAIRIVVHRRSTGATVSRRVELERPAEIQVQVRQDLAPVLGLSVAGVVRSLGVRDDEGHAALDEERESRACDELEPDE